MTCSFRQLRDRARQTPETCCKTSSRIFLESHQPPVFRRAETTRRTDSRATTFPTTINRRRRSLKRNLLKDFYFFPARRASTNLISSLRPRSDNYVASASYSSSVYSVENAGKWGPTRKIVAERGSAPKKKKERKKENTVAR